MLDNVKRIIIRAEFILATVLTLSAICMHITVLLNAKGLWRDEINTVNLSQSASLIKIYDKMAFDSSGLAWLMALRCWSAIGLHNDFNLRVFGFIIGIAILCMLIWSARTFGTRIPVFTIGLFCITPNVVIFGDSLRAYGCATAFLLLTTGLVFEFILNPTNKKAFAAACAGIISIHCAFPNVALVIAVYAGGLAVALWEHRQKEVKIFVLLLVTTLASVIVYYPTSLRVADWIIIKKQAVEWTQIFQGFSRIFGFSSTWFSIATAGIPLIAIIAAVWTLLPKNHEEIHVHSKKAVFILTASTSAIIGQFVYFKLLSYVPYPWHYLPFFGLVCLFAETGFLLLIKASDIMRIVRIGAIAGYAFIIVPNTAYTLQYRRTNMDLIARKINTLADRNDLIVVHPFFYGISFSRYYSGSTPWTTLPQISDHSLHRWDLIKEKMKETEPEKDIIRNVESTLKSGHRVWIVGILQMPRKQGQPIIRSVPAPHPRFGWNENFYEYLWSVILGQAIKNNAVSLRNVPLEFKGKISEFENVHFYVARGQLKQ